MDRLLQYSLERNRAIRLIYMDEAGKLHQITCVVTALDAKQLTVYVLRPPRNLVLNREDVLSADYKKGDDGGE